MISVDSDWLKTQGYRQVGKARVSESRMRWFESSYPCHMNIEPVHKGWLFCMSILYSYCPE